MLHQRIGKQTVAADIEDRAVNMVSYGAGSGA